MYATIRHQVPADIDAVDVATTLFAGLRSSIFPVEEYVIRPVCTPAPRSRKTMPVLENASGRNVHRTHAADHGPPSDVVHVADALTAVAPVVALRLSAPRLAVES